MRLAAAVAVIGIFFGLGYLKSNNILGLGGLLKSEAAFFGTAFGLVGLVAASYFLYLYQKP
jgi:hypothetical protein